VVSVENLLKTFIVKEVVVGAVDNVSFKVDEGAFFTLLGPSGCGKTTILRCLAGLERPEKGRIQIGQKEVFASERKLYVQTSQRDIGMVFQSYAIWPHMSVFKNVAYPLRFKKVSTAEMNKRVNETLAVVGLAELGDRQWRDLLVRHNSLIRRELGRFRGREIDTAGDGFFVTFDGPARAIRCAEAIQNAVTQLGLTVRVGLHTGECEIVDEKVTGIAVHIGARVMNHAEPGEVLVTSTVKDLVAGSGIGFVDRGAYELKGVPGKWRMFAVVG